MSRFLLVALSLSLPLAAQGLYTNAAKPGDPICSRIIVDKDPTLENHALSDSNPAAAFTYQYRHQFFTPDQRTDASAFKVYDDKGKGTSIADLKGKIVVVGFWSRNCEPSARMILEMAALQANKDKFGFELLPVNFDGADTGSAQGQSHTLSGWASVARFKQQNAVFFRDHSIPFYLNGTGKEGPSCFQSSFPSMPALFLIDPQGRVATADVGYTDKLVAQRLSMLIREGQAAKAASK